MALVYESSHAIVRQKLAMLRAVETPPPMFRSLVRSLGTILGVDATSDLPTRRRTIQTPLGEADGVEFDGSIAIVPILRAGLGMADGLLELLPDAQVWHIGLVRDEVTLQPSEYCCKVPERPDARVAIVCDPMLATGGSAVRACEILRDSGVESIRYVCLIAAPEGIAYLSSTMPNVPIIVGAIDERLTDNGFIFPGLGDAGDRQFGT